MFRFDYRKDEQRRREKELLKEVRMTEKPKFKDLVAIMFAQYLIILPVAFIGIIVFALAIKLLLKYWGS
ncbi:hypothetical protein H9X78_05100 [Clostridium saudiense]|nr:hypothetical protein [Clostridium saudiense]MBM6859873.1 hypothetical protein [Clostridium saudiense]